MRLALCLAALTLMAACVPPRAEQGAALYAANCAGCHGAGGRGDSPAAGGLPYAPTDLTTLAAANGGTFPTAGVLAQIYGYPGRHHLGLMPEFGAILEGPKTAVTLEDGTRADAPVALAALVAYLQTLQQP